MVTGKCPRRIESRHRTRAAATQGRTTRAEILDTTERCSRRPVATSRWTTSPSRPARPARRSTSTSRRKEEVLTALHQRMYSEMARPWIPLHGRRGHPRRRRSARRSPVRANWRAHRDALRTFHETAMVSAEFETEWRQRLEQHVTALTAIIERERSAGHARGEPADRRHRLVVVLDARHQCYLLFRRARRGATRWSSSRPWTSSGDG